MDWRLLRAGLALVTAMAAPAHAVPDDYKVNVREGCRQAVSGAYITAYTERERNRTLIRSLAGNVQDTAAALKAAQADLARLKAASEGKDFDLQHAVKIDQATTRVSTLDAQRADYGSLQDQAKRAFDAAQAQEKRLFAALTKVFTVERMNDRADGGFPIRLEYKSPCPKYRALCPLPVDDAKNLLAIPMDGGTPQSCQRYATQSKLR